MTREELNRELEEALSALVELRGEYSDLEKCALEYIKHMFEPHTDIMRYLDKLYFLSCKAKALDSALIDAEAKLNSANQNVEGLVQ